MVRKLRTFFRNVWFFRRELSMFQWWDYSFTLYLMEKSFQSMEDGLREKGNEVLKPRMKKVASISRAREIIRNIKEDNFIEQAEKKLGRQMISRDISWEQREDGCFNMISNTTSEQDNLNREIILLANKIERDEWCEFCTILKGQDPDDYKLSEKKEDCQDWDDWFDGTGMKGWWD